MSLQDSANRSVPGKIADVLRVLLFGDLMAQFGGARNRTTGTTPALTIDTNDVVFPRPVLSIQSMSATVNAKNLPVTIGAAAIEGTTPSPHTATATRSAAGLITRLTFTGPPTVPVAWVVEENTGLAANLAGTEI